ncbi:OsmC family protein [candidate division WOR-3 bacterium]|nr:OsmC family protein [candidate division WOR-3 bacterium]
MEAKVKLIDNLQFIGTSSSNHSIIMDASRDVGGEDSGIKPMELFLVSLAGCTGMDVASLLIKMRVKINGLAIEVKGEREKEHPKIFKDIELKYIVKGRNIEGEKIKKAITLSQDKYCSISEMLKKGGCKLTYSYEIQYP